MGDRLRAGIPPRYVTKPTRSTQPCIPLGSLNRVPALIGWGNRRNVTSAGWQVILCDPMWHVSSRSGVVLAAQTAIRFLTLAYLSLNFYGSDALPDNQETVLKHWRQMNFQSCRYISQQLCYNTYALYLKSWDHAMYTSASKCDSKLCSVSCIIMLWCYSVSVFDCLDCIVGNYLWVVSTHTAQPAA